MPRKALPRIVSIAAAEKANTLRIQWQSGRVTETDVSDLIAKFRVYAPLLASPGLFAQVRLGEHGTDVVWNDEIDMAAETLWRLAQEQSGLAMSPDSFRHWRERKAYTLDSAAEALGLSRRMVAYYEQGEKPIPKVVALAARALEMM